MLSQLRNIWIQTRKRYRKYGIRPALINLYVFVVNRMLRVLNRLTAAHCAACPCCGWKGYGFLLHDVVGYYKTDSVCPSCKAHEKHRWFYLYFSRTMAALPSEGPIVHFAAEPWVANLLRPALGTRYHTADLQERDVDLRADLTDLPLGTDTVGALIVFNVLEHVGRDLAALNEMRRVLRRHGRLYLCVPLRGWSLPTLEYDAPRPHDNYHVRKYGLDIRDKLRRCGFQSKMISPESVLDQSSIRLYSLKGNSLLECRPM